jgi:hypothetical protein
MLPWKELAGREGNRDDKHDVFETVHSPVAFLSLFRIEAQLGLWAPETPLAVEDQGRLLYTKRDEEDSELGYMGGGDFFRGYGEDKGGR